MQLQYLSITKCFAILHVFLVNNSRLLPMLNYCLKYCEKFFVCHWKGLNKNKYFRNNSCLVRASRTEILINTIFLFIKNSGIKNSQNNLLYKLGTRKECRWLVYLHFNNQPEPILRCRSAAGETLVITTNFRSFINNLTRRTQQRATQLLSPWFVGRSH